MTDPVPRARHWAAPALIAILAAAIVVVVVIGVASAMTAPRPAGTAQAAAPSASGSVAPGRSAAPSPSPVVLSSPKPTATKAPPVPVVSAPQPTRTAAISSRATIVRSLTAKVTKLEAVQGQASGPGEVSGPAVRFTITITNTTGATVNLSNTVVNAYFGADTTPAIQLEKPGAVAFPFSVKDGGSATGVFVFNIPEASRDRVEVTVDTSVKNPVVAFRGPAPR